MRKLILTVLVFVSMLPQAAYSQVNYVLNGGFEQYSSCPTDFDQIKKAKYWQPVDSVDNDPLCSSDYCNICAVTGSSITIPIGAFYDHYPHTGGGGCVLSLMYSLFLGAGSYQRDYTQGKLYSHLTAGKEYCVTFYVILAQNSQRAVNKMGAYLDNGSIDAGKDSAGCALPQTAYTPQVYGTAIIDDAVNWTKIQGNFTATGTERFITIGNFFDVDHTDTIGLTPSTVTPYTWYLIDDVSVIASDAMADAGPSGLVSLGDSVHIGVYEDGLPCTWYILGNPTPIGYGGGMYVHPIVTTTYVVAMDLCNGITYDTVTKYVCATGVSALNFPGELLQLYPNPATTELHIDHAANCEVSITNLLGQQVLRTRLVNDKAVVNIGGIAKGIYMVQVSDSTSGKSVVRRVELGFVGF